MQMVHYKLTIIYYLNKSGFASQTHFLFIVINFIHAVILGKI